MEKKEYIERGAVIDILRKYSTENPSSLGRHSGVADIAMCEVDRLPATDVVEVVHGEWEIVSESYRLFDDYDEAFSVKCPFCDRTYYVPFEFEEEKMIAYAREHYPFCHCGAKMDGGKHETD